MDGTIPVARNQPPTKSTRLRVAAVQMKFRNSIRKNVEFIVDSLSLAARDGADAVLFPECSVTGYRCEFDRLDPRDIDAALANISEAGRRVNCNVLVGSPVFRKRKWLNALLVFDRTGRERFCYSKIHLTEHDTRFFAPGNSLAYFHLDGIPCTAIICHERRYPELVRIPVMMGAQIVFHPNAGLDRWSVTRAKRGGRDGISVRAFENQVFYVFANSVGPQGPGLWSAGDSKIIAPDSSVLALANNRDETIVQATLDLRLAGRKYAREALDQPAFLRRHWRSLLTACRRQCEANQL